MKQLDKLLGKFWESRPELTSDRELRVTPEWDASVTSDQEVIEEYITMRKKRFVALPGYLLQCAGAEVLSTMPDEVIKPHRKDILKHRQHDMLAFAKFLVSTL